MNVSDQVLEITNLTKYYGDKLLLDSVSLSINRKDRIGLVGENGTGKTTLANIIMGRVDADEYQRRQLPTIEIGYLPQEAVIDEAISVQQFLEQSLGALDKMRDQLAALEHAMGATDIMPEALADLLDEYGTLQERFTAVGGYDLDYRVDQVFAGLDLAHIDRSRSMQTLSGGEKTRTMLARLLLSSPDLLILDEPTNHLDFSAVDWLESYLINYSGAVLIISHDRRFLNKVVTQIVQLSPADHKLTVYHGNYDAYMAERDRQRSKLAAAYEAQQEEIKTLQQLLKVKTHSAGKGKPMRDNNKMAYDAAGERVQQSRTTQINAVKRRLEELHENAIDRPALHWRMNPDFAPDDLVSRDVIKLRSVSKAYGDRVLFSDVTATVTSGQRVVITGPNGAGKTTLMRLILGMEAPDNGEIRVASNARIGYLDQEQETLDPRQTVLEAYSRDLIGLEEEHRANLHKYGLFTADQALQRVGNLSIGQQRKLQIARLIAQKANVLLLDEPTNHLDLESVEQFEQALCEFNGTIVAISHDRMFTEHVATVTWLIHNGEFTAQTAQQSLA
jgi:macrolide transport system ATP-binding/permease protein